MHGCLQHDMFVCLFVCYGEIVIKEFNTWLYIDQLLHQFISQEEENVIATLKIDGCLL